RLCRSPERFAGREWIPNSGGRAVRNRTLDAMVHVLHGGGLRAPERDRAEQHVHGLLREGYSISEEFLPLHQQDSNWTVSRTVWDRTRHVAGVARLRQPGLLHGPLARRG